MGIARVSIRWASEDAADPSSAAHEVAASARCAKRMDCESNAFAVFAEVKTMISPRAFDVATTVLFEAPDDEVELVPVPSRAAAAAEAASPDEKEVVTTRVFCPSARAVALVNELPPSCEVDLELVVMFRGAVGSKDVIWVL
jgi:hypothetical protein